MEDMLVDENSFDFSILPSAVSVFRSVLFSDM